MRATTDLPREPRRRSGSGRGRTWLIAGGVLLFILLTSLRGIAGFYTDFLWFESLGFEGVFTGVLGAKIALAVIFIGLFFLAMWANLLIAERLAPKFRPPGPEEEMIERFEDLVGERQGLLRVLISLFFAFTVGVGASDQWEEWILFTNGSDFGIDDPQFGTDIGFYVFRLPFLSFIAGWAFAALLIIFIVTSSRPLPQRGHQGAGAGSAGDQPGQGSPVGAARSAGPGSGRRLLAPALRAHRFDPRHGRRRRRTPTSTPNSRPSSCCCSSASPASGCSSSTSGAVDGCFPCSASGCGPWWPSSPAASTPSSSSASRSSRASSRSESPFIDENIEATRFALGLDNVETERYPYNRRCRDHRSHRRRTDRGQHPAVGPQRQHPRQDVSAAPGDP